MTAIREERRLVTCMFVDIVGSTELTMRFGAERLKRELGTAFGEISRIIVAHGGTVEKYIGDAIYALFGAPIAHEDDTLRALRAAEAVRDWCAADAEHGHPFAVRLGVETGEAVIDLAAAASTKQQMSVGPVVNFAARLQQRADPGEVLVGPAAHEVAADAAEFEPLPETELKGLGRVAMWRLVGVGSAERVSLPFVGREAEIALLGYAYERAVKGRCVLSVVSGPPGQGKTRLVQEFLQGRAAGALVIGTRCRPTDETGVFAPVRGLLGVQTIDELAEQVGRICSDDVECERVVAGLAESAGIGESGSLAGLPAGEREDEIVNAWRRYLALLGTDRLVVLAIDDIHWADPWVVRLVDRLTFGGPRLLVVATARPEFADSAGIRPSGDRFFIELEGLEPEAARHLAALAGRGDERVVERAEGNPLFVVELARALPERGDLPLTLQGALGARLDQLATGERVLLSLAAVAGERFSAADVAFLAQRDVPDVGRALARLADLHFLDIIPSGYRFHHGLLRDVAYSRLLAAERMRAHAAFARERVHPEDAEALAYHWWEALRPPDAEWVWADDPDVPRMRREAFGAHLAAGKRHADHAAADRALELIDHALGFADDDPQRALAHQTMAKAYQQILRQDEAWSHLRESLDLYRRAGATPLDVYVDLTEAAKWSGAFRQRPSQEAVTRIADEGRAAAEAAGDARSVAAILAAYAGYMVNTHQSDPDAAVAHLDAAITAAEASGDATMRRTAIELKISRLEAAGYYDEMGALIDELHSTERDLGTFSRMGVARVTADYHFAMAHRSENTAEVDALTAMAEPMGPHNRTHAWNQATELYIALGDWAKVKDLAQGTAKLLREAPGTAFCVAAANILRDGAVAHALRGEREDALALMAIDVTDEIERDIVLAIPRALLGFPSPETDAKLAEKARSWWSWFHAVFRAVILQRPDDAEIALARMGAVVEHAVAYRALAEGVREAVAEMRGGPAATYASLRRIGYLGWIEILRRRVNAEY
jgi:class 3 adenylate cyclase/tetratricopeptide (TPR) repeat protein